MPTTGYHSITSDTKCSQQQVGKFPKPATATSSHCSGSAISSDNISEEITTLESHKEELSGTSQEEKSTTQYATVRFPKTCVHIPPTSDVPVQYTVIGGHLNAVRIVME